MDMRKWDNKHKVMTLRLVLIILLIAAVAFYKARGGTLGGLLAEPTDTSGLEIETLEPSSPERTTPVSTAAPTETTAEKTTKAEKTTAEKTTKAEKTTDEKTAQAAAVEKTSKASKTEKTTEAVKETGPGGITVEEDGTYTDKDHVALYIHLYGKLPSNFITKKEAEALGWSGGSLKKYAKGKSIGGSSYGNYEGLLPTKKGRKYYECDIDYTGGSRGAKRIVYSNDGMIFYTDDHYETFTQLYP